MEHDLPWEHVGHGAQTWSVVRRAAAHRSESAGHVPCRTVGQSGMDSDGVIEVGVGRRQDGGHCAAGGQSCHEGAAADRIFVQHSAGYRRDDVRFTLVAALVFWAKPVPAACRIGRTRLGGIGDQQALGFGGEVHCGASGKILGILLASVEHDDEPARTMAGGNEQPVVARAGARGDATLQEGSALGQVQRPCRAQRRKVRAAAQPADGFAETQAQRRRALWDSRRGFRQSLVR